MAEPISKDKTAEIERLRKDAAACQACPLWKNATQTVFGEGPADADLLFVGEQPGDREDRAGRPFVGPAGLMFDKALEEAEVDRSRTYVTNAVKHFKFEPRGKLRLHKKPSAGEIDVCRRWLFAEIHSTAAPDRGARRDRRAKPDRTPDPHRRQSRQGPRGGGGPSRVRDRASLLTPACPRRIPPSAKPTPSSSPISARLARSRRDVRANGGRNLSGSAGIPQRRARRTRSRARPLETPA